MKANDGSKNEVPTKRKWNERATRSEIIATRYSFELMSCSNKITTKREVIENSTPVVTSGTTEIKSAPRVEPTIQ